MTTQAKKVVKIKPLEGYTAMSDDDIVHVGTAVQSGLTGNSNFQNLPVDLAILKTNIESLSALIVESLDGSKKVIAQKNKQREAVIKMLRVLGRFVEVHSDNDMAIFTSSGFVAASTTKVPPAPLPVPVIRSVDHGVISGELVIQVEAIRKAVNYEIRCGAQVGMNGVLRATFRRKNRLLDRPISGSGSLVRPIRFFGGLLSHFCRLKGQNSSDIDQIIRNHAQSNPSFHAVIASISTTIQTVSSFEHADPAFATCSPGLRSTKPSFLL